MPTVETHVERIALPNQLDSLKVAIENSCDLQAEDGFHLCGTFVFETDLVLVFQKVSGE